MGKMSDMCIEIADMLKNGYDAQSIALILEIPESWVLEVSDNLDEYV